MQALALADREGVAAVVAADHDAVAVDYGSGSRAEPALEELPGVAVGDEADVVAVWLGGHGQAAVRRLLAHLVLGRVADREHGPGQLLAGQHGEHVRLVLVRVNAAGQAGTTGPTGLSWHQARVVAGADRVEAERHRPVEHGGKLDLLVAAQAG